MRKYSLKRQKENREYSKLRVAYLEANQMCEARVSEDCQARATTIHHTAGRQGTKLNDVSLWKGVCMNCHDWIERNPRAAKDLGLSESRLKPNYDDIKKFVILKDGNLKDIEEWTNEGTSKTEDADFEIIEPKQIDNKESFSILVFCFRGGLVAAPFLLSCTKWMMIL